MRLGNRRAALVEYEKLKALLRAELDVDPLPETERGDAQACWPASARHGWPDGESRRIPRTRMMPQEVTAIQSSPDQGRRARISPMSDRTARGQGCGRRPADRRRGSAGACGAGAAGRSGCSRCRARPHAGAVHLGRGRRPDRRPDRDRQPARLRVLVRARRHAAAPAHRRSTRRLGDLVYRCLRRSTTTRPPTTDLAGAQPARHAGAPSLRGAARRCAAWRRSLQVAGGRGAARRRAGRGGAGALPGWSTTARRAIGVRDPSSRVFPTWCEHRRRATGDGMVVAFLDTGINDAPDGSYPGHESLIGRCLGGAVVPRTPTRRSTRRATAA